PGAEFTRGRNACVPGIEPQHHFANAHQVPAALFLGLDLHSCPVSDEGAECETAIKGRFGSTSSQAKPPATLNAAATRNEQVQPYCWAIAGVRDAVSAPPNCAPMFMKPDVEPALFPAMSAVTDQ